MPAPKKDAPKASTPTPAAPAETSGPLTTTEPASAAAAPSETPAAPSAPPAPDAGPTADDEHEEALAKLAREDDGSDADAANRPPIPAGQPPQNTPTPLLESEESEVDRLRRLLAEQEQRHERDMRSASDRIAELSHKPAAAPEPVRDPLREAKLFGVLATWKGPGTYGGPYYTLKGVRMPHATGLVTGYFPRACVDKFVDQFTRVK